MQTSGTRPRAAIGSIVSSTKRLELVDVVVDGDVAVLTAGVVDDVTMGGQRAELRFVTIQVYVRLGSGWLYLAGHTAPSPNA